MKISKFILSSAFTLAVLAPALRAEPITTFTSMLTSSSATEAGRPSRSGVPQDWSGTETYSGVFNPSITYYYQTYTLSSSLFTGAPFVEVSFFDEGNSQGLFISAYANSYSTADRGLNWLGDAGSTGNYFGVDPTGFDVVLPSGANLVLVVNNTVSGGYALNAPFDVTVNAYADTQFSDPAPVPEPSTIVTLGTGLLGLAAAARRRLTFKA